ncbi:MAG: methyltransferase domain-containing protein [Ruminococcaceae bacterium]|nr:methyltransferase domain-containing protein [Oscillospiraceae bacterium]
MEHWWRNRLVCPVCGSALVLTERSFACTGPRRHCFDMAAEGYVNLAPPKAAGGGDDAGLIAARTAFLEAGYYRPFADRVAALMRQHCPGGVLVDAGCGEGYYTNHLAGGGARVFGFDLSKRGVRHGAKRAAREELPALYAVASVFTLPLADASVDGIVSLFAPVAEVEFLRVLKPGGVLLMAGAGAEHLLSLKRVLYDTPRPNEARGDLPRMMRQLHAETLRFEMELPRSAAQDLFAMTPYAYRTAAEGRQRLAAVEHLTCEAEMDIFVFQKA